MTSTGRAPAGWYPDPDPDQLGSSRWWDGYSWAPLPMPPSTEPPVQVRRTDTVWVWFVIALPLLSGIGSVLLADLGDPLRRIIEQTFASIEEGSRMRPLDTWRITFEIMPSVLWLNLASYAVIGVVVLFAWLDWRELRRRGIPRPFHWAFALLGFVGAGVIVYMIGRSVVVRRHGGSPVAFWVWIVTEAIALAAALVYATVIIVQLANTLMTSISGLSFGP